MATTKCICRHACPTSTHLCQPVRSRCTRLLVIQQLRQGTKSCHPSGHTETISPAHVLTDISSLLSDNSPWCKPSASGSQTTALYNPCKEVIPYTELFKSGHSSETLSCPASQLVSFLDFSCDNALGYVIICTGPTWCDGAHGLLTQHTHVHPASCSSPRDPAVSGWTTQKLNFLHLSTRSFPSVVFTAMGNFQTFTPTPCSCLCPFPCHAALDWPCHLNVCTAKHWHREALFHSASSSHLCQKYLVRPVIPLTGEHYSQKSCPMAYLSLPHLKLFGTSSCRTENTSISPPRWRLCCCQPSFPLDDYTSPFLTPYFSVQVPTVRVVKIKTFEKIAMSSSSYWTELVAHLRMWAAAKSNLLSSSQHIPIHTYGPWGFVMTCNKSVRSDWVLGLLQSLPCSDHPRKASCPQAAGVDHLCKPGNSLLLHLQM